MKPTQDNIVKAAKMVKCFNLQNLIEFGQWMKANYALIGGGLYIVDSPNKQGVPSEDVDECVGTILNWAEHPKRNLIFRQFYNMLRAIRSPIESGIIPPVKPPGDGD